jgi:hypothetical protein
MDRLISCAMIAAILLGLAQSTAMSIPAENEVTVYMLSCEGEQVGETCQGSERTDTPFTYKVLVDRQSVWYWPMDDLSRSSRFSMCAVRDSKNWLCQMESGEASQSIFEMTSGKYAEIEACTTGPAHTVFHQVSMWQWWVVWLREKLLNTVPSHSGAHI